MSTTEPTPTALMLLVFGGLGAASVLLSGASGRFGVPVMLLFLGLGMLAGSEGLLNIPFADHGLAFRVGTITLVLILFDGGLSTRLPSSKAVLGASAVLATVGVVITAALLSVGVHLLGMPWREALLLGAVVSSTDAAAVFSILRNSGLHIQRRAALTVEIESGANDPVAVILTIAVTESVLGDQLHGWAIAGDILVQILVGGAVGLAVGALGRAALVRVRVPAAGMYPVLSLSLALLSFAIATLLWGSGFLAVYVAALVLGRARLPYKTGLMRVHDGLAWLSQIAMFLLLGLLVFPSELAPIAGTGLAVGALLTFLARPLAVVLCLLPFRYGLRELAFIAWVGLRGAVPIVLATYPVLAGAPGAHRVFNIVFFVVVMSALLQGASVPWLARKLGLVADEPPPPSASLDITSTSVLDSDVMTFHVDRRSPAVERTIAELGFPAGAAAMLVIRGRQLIAPKGATKLVQGDYVYVFARRGARPEVEHIFGEEAV